MFLSRLNEINGGCEKILPVSLSFWSNLKLSSLLTRKFPMFLLGLSESNGGCEKNLPVSLSFWSNIKLKDKPVGYIYITVYIANWLAYIYIYINIGKPVGYI